MTQNERISENEINLIWQEIQKKLRSSLERYVNEECAKVLSRLFSLTIHPSFISVILSKKEELERTPVTRAFMDEMRRELKTKSDQVALEFEKEVGEEVGECLRRLLKTDFMVEWIDDIPVEGYKEKIKEELKKYEGAKGLLSIFDNAMNKDSLGTMKVIGFYCGKFEEQYFKIFDSMRLIHQISEEDLFEIKAVNLMCSINILIEAYYRKLVSLILDLLKILEGEEPTLKLKYVGGAYKKFKNGKYTEKYPEIELFFKKWINDIRNAIAHSDYKIVPAERKIQILDGTKR